MRRSCVLAALLLLSAMVVGCQQTTTLPTRTDIWCEADAIIPFSASKDRSITVFRLQQHNAAWCSNCAAYDDRCRVILEALE